MRRSRIVQAQQLPHLCFNGATDEPDDPGATAKTIKARLTIMAFVNTTRAAQPAFGDRFAAALETLRTVMARRAIYRQTVQELRALSDKDLGDLGIHRSEIRRMAQEAAYGK